jgi:hypothetical protein
VATTGFTLGAYHVAVNQLSRHVHSLGVHQMAPIPGMATARTRESQGPGTGDAPSAGRKRSGTARVDGRERQTSRDGA